MTLKFENSAGVERVIAQVISEDEVFREIHKFLKEHNFRSYYIRKMYASGQIIYDVGSHTEFFHLYYD